jgi:anti-anti-sigma factor
MSGLVVTRTAEVRDLLTSPRWCAHLSVDVSVRDKIAILDLQGELDLCSLGVLDEQLAQALSTGAEWLVLDVSGLTIMDCAGARALVEAAYALSDGHRPLLRSPSQMVRRLLEVTGWEACFDLET